MKKSFFFCLDCFVFFILRLMQIELTFEELQKGRYSNDHDRTFDDENAAKTSFEMALQRLSHVQDKTMGLVQYSAVSAGLIGVIATCTEKVLLYRILTTISLVSLVFSILLGTYGNKVSSYCLPDFNKWGSMDQGARCKDLGDSFFENSNTADFYCDIYRAAQRYFSISLVFIAINILFLIWSSDVQNNNSIENILAKSGALNLKSEFFGNLQGKFNGLDLNGTTTIKLDSVLGSGTYR